MINRNWFWRYRLFFLTAIVLLIAASRIVQITKLDMDYDDAWSIWQTFGSPAQIVAWTPFDWPPLYYLTLGAWKEVAGITPFVLRYFSILAFIVGLPCLYRVARRIGNERSAIISLLVYGALGYALYLSLFLRSYGLLLSLLSLALWLTVRYFDRPSWRRALLLALCLIVMFYLHYTSVLAFGLIGLYTLFAYPRRLWRWWLPVLMLSLAVVPHVLAKLSVFTGRTSFYRGITLAPIQDALLKLTKTFMGVPFPYFIILLIVATLLVIFRKRFQPPLIALALWCLSPIAVYLLQSKLGLFQDPRYMWWALIGLVLWIGLGLSRLPDRMLIVVALSLIGCLFLPQPLAQYQPVSPFGENFKLLRRDYREGDVILIDPRCGRDCGAIEAWDYFTRLYFPEGLTFVTNPAGHQRVWYISIDWLKDPATAQALEHGFIAGEYFGPPSFLFRLYSAPPNQEGIVFENGIRWHGVELDQPTTTPYGLVFRDGATIHMRFWWSVDKPPPLDYSLSVLVFNQGVPVIQLDGPPQVLDAPQATSQWQPGHYYIEDRTITLPSPLPKGTYTFYLAMYYWQDQKRLTVPGVQLANPVPGQGNLLPIQTINVQSWN